MTITQSHIFVTCWMQDGLQRTWPTHFVDYLLFHLQLLLVEKLIEIM